MSRLTNTVSLETYATALRAEPGEPYYLSFQVAGEQYGINILSSGFCAFL